MVWHGSSYDTASSQHNNNNNIIRDPKAYVFTTIIQLDNYQLSIPTVRTNFPVPDAVKQSLRGMAGYHLQIRHLTAYLLRSSYIPSYEKDYLNC